MSNETNIQTKKLNKKLLIGAVAVIAIALVVVLAVFVPQSANAKKLEEQLSLGDKYLSELQYEQAVVAYLAAIEIDPKNLDAYLGLADVYIAQGEYDMASEVLEDALEELGEDAGEVKGKLDEVEQLRQATEVTPTIAPTSTPVPTATNTPVPTATNTPVPTATNTPTPTPTPTPEPAITVVSAADAFEWSDNGDGTLSVTGMKELKEPSMVEIPAEVDGKKVTKVGFNAFGPVLGKVHLLGIIMPEGMLEIGDYAFSGCSYAKTITLPESIVDIGEGAFYSCGSLESIKIPKKVTEIKDETFHGCYSLKELYFHEEFEVIGWQAFSECDSLEKIVLPNSVRKVDEYAFSSCIGLKEIIIEEGATTILEAGVFASCENLISAVIPSGVKFNKMISRYYDCFYGTPNLTIITPSGSEAEQYAKEHDIPVQNP